MGDNNLFKKLFSAFILFLLLASFSVNIVHAQVVPWVEWTQSYGGVDDDRAYSVVATSDGGFALAGDTYSFGMGKNDFWLIKTDSLGNMLWNRTYGGSDYDACYSIIVTSDGGFALAGYTWSFGNGLRDFWLVKTDGDGIVEWNQTYGGEGADSAYSVCQSSDGGFVLAGVTYSFGAGESDVWLVKTDAFGNVEWEKTYGSSALEGAYCMVKTSDGGYALAGHKRSAGVGYSYVWLLKTDSSGNLEWDQIYGGEDGDRAVDLVQASDGGYALACLKYSANGPEDPPENDLPDFWLIKTDGFGNLEWDKSMVEKLMILFLLL